MKNRSLACFGFIMAMLLLLAACAPASPAATSTAEVISVSSAEWKIEIKSAIWGGDSAMIPLGAGEKQLLVFTNLEYIGPESDVTVPAFGVKDDQGRELTIIASFGYGKEVPAGGEKWISSFVTGNPATRHFTTGEAFRPLMFTFAGAEDAKKFTFFFGDLTVDITPVLQIN